MKNKLYSSIVFALVLINFQPAHAQKSLTVNDYVNVTMDLQGILELKMTTEPDVNFVFNTIKKYEDGITIFNATKLEVNSTIPWDLYVQPATQYWNQNTSYNSSSLQNNLPSEILEIKSFPSNNSNLGFNCNEFIGLTSKMGTNTTAHTPGIETQFISGSFNQREAELSNMRFSSAHPLSNQFSIHYRIKPGLKANFPNLKTYYPDVATKSFSESPFAQPGYYDLEVVYTLTEDL